MHLTNYSVNKYSDDFVAAKEEAVNILKDNSSTKRTLSSLWDTLSHKKVNVDKIKKNIA